ncbi:MAG: DUF3108 domain-containing protein [Betaproteobacteria bacterium]|nr:DUF3108 domain-containing protein [Betaproteobacteria bacterium]
MRFIAALLIAFVVLPAWATTPPQGFVARYNLSLESMPLGETERKLERLPNGEFLYSTRSYATGVAAMLMKDRIGEQSRFRFQKGQFQPLEYRYERNGGKKTKLRSARFDWQAKQVEGSHDGEAWQLALKPGVMDGLLYQLLASHDLQKQRKRFSYQVVDRGELKRYELNVVGVETVETPMGPLTALKLQRQEGEYETTLWMAKELAYLPVRIEHTEDGKRYRADLKALSGMVPAKRAKAR